MFGHNGHRQKEFIKAKKRDSQVNLGSRKLPEKVVLGWTTGGQLGEGCEGRENAKGAAPGGCPAAWNSLEISPLLTGGRVSWWKFPPAGKSDTGVDPGQVTDPDLMENEKIGHGGLSSPFQPQNCPLPLDRSRNPQLIKMPVGALLSRCFTPAPSFLLLHQ